MYNDYYLKFADEAEMLEVFSPILVDEQVPCYSGPLAIDVVGRIVDTPAVMDEEGNVTAEATFVDGWHVNVRSLGDLPSEYTAYAVAPNTPARVWA